MKITLKEDDIDKCESSLEKGKVIGERILEINKITPLDNRASGNLIAFAIENLIIKRPRKLQKMSEILYHATMEFANQQELSNFQARVIMTLASSEMRESLNLTKYQYLEFMNLLMRLAPPQN